MGVSTLKKWGGGGGHGPPGPPGSDAYAVATKDSCINPFSIKLVSDMSLPFTTFGLQKSSDAISRRQIFKNFLGEHVLEEQHLCAGHSFSPPPPPPPAGPILNVSS